MNGLKQRLQRGEALFGTFLSLGNPVTSELVASVGFDWLLIDLEHGMGSETDVLTQLQAIEHTGVPAIVRIESYVKQRIHKVLDMGAHGIMCPRINTAEEAEWAMSGMHYPPRGIRGVAKMVRATQFGANFDQYNADTNQLLGVIQIETIESLNDVDRIAQVEGVDVLFIGPADLTMSLGVFGQINHPLFVDAVERIIQAAKSAGKAIGILLFDVDDYERYYELGIRFFACGTDALFLSKAAENTVKALQQKRDKIQQKAS
jgi:4-hydroxy-2-oxoheptanedioate aldolase